MSPALLRRLCEERGFNLVEHWKGLDQYFYYVKGFRRGPETVWQGAGTELRQATRADIIAAMDRWERNA